MHSRTKNASLLERCVRIECEWLCSLHKTMKEEELNLTPAFVMATIHEGMSSEESALRRTVVA